MKWKGLAYQFLFYTGSRIKRDAYQGFMDRMIERNMTLQTEFRLSEQDGKENILVGHSFGGYFALLDSIRFPDKVAGVVLIHSHFNSRFKMPYPWIRQSDVRVPVLTILAGRDERLPIHRAIDDLLERNREGYQDKFYHVVSNNTHFSGIVDDAGRDDMVERIGLFGESIRTKNFSRLKNDPIYERFRSRVARLSTNTILTSDSMSPLDAILRITVPRCLWDSAHWLWFLSTRPGFLHFMYEDQEHVFWKGSPDDIENLRKRVQEWTGITPSQLQLFRLPTIHPAILLWLSLPLFPYREKDGTITIPVITLRVKPGVVYYKIPHPDKVYRLVCRIGSRSKSPNGDFF